MHNIKSRKFIVWIVWSIIVIGSIVYTKSIDANMFSWYGGITMIYIGGNVASKYIYTKGQIEKKDE